MTVLLIRRAAERPIGMLPAIALAVSILTVPATAASEQASLRGVGGEIGEVSHTVDIDLRAGAIARIKTTQVVVATSLDPGVTDAQAVYTFDLPSTSAVTGLEVVLAGGKRSSGHVVNASAARAKTDAPPGGRPDAAVLRLIALDGERATYELRVFPISAKRTTQWTIEWLLPVRHVAGAGRLRIPPRGQPGNLVTESITVRNVPRRYATVVGSGRDLGGRRTVSFKGSLRFGVVAELLPRNDASEPSLEFATAALTSGRGAALVRIEAGTRNHSNETAAERVLFVIDTSRSMGQSRALADKLVAALLEDVPADAAIDAITFDRGAQSLLGGFAANTGAHQKRLLAALADVPSRSGSDLAGALALADRRLSGTTGGGRVILISDGITPTSQTPNAIAQSVSTAFLSDVRVAHIILVPEDAPPPKAGDLGASSLTTRKGSRELVLRTGVALRESNELWRKLWAPPPLEDIALSNEDRFLTEQPDYIGPGDDVVLAGFVRGRPPTSLQLTAAGALTVRGRVGRALDKMVLPLVLATAQDLPSDWDELDFADAAIAAHVVSHETMLLVPYPGDRFAGERLRLAREFGSRQFRRVAPVIEDQLASYRFVAPPPPLRQAPRSRPDAPTGSLDRGIAERLVRTHVIPKARGCYKRALLPSKNLRGTLTLVFEMARGEVHDARVEGSLQGEPAWAAQIEKCVIDAAYSIRVPTVHQGSSSEAISLVRFPLRFHIVDHRGRIVPAAAESADNDPADDPLGGL